MKLFDYRSKEMREEKEKGKAFEDEIGNMIDRVDFSLKRIAEELAAAKVRRDECTEDIISFENQIHTVCGYREEVKDCKSIEELRVAQLFCFARIAIESPRHERESLLLTLKELEEEWK